MGGARVYAPIRAPPWFVFLLMVFKKLTRAWAGPPWADGVSTSRLQAGRPSLSPPLRPACRSLLCYASQHVLDRVGKGCKPNYNKQVRQGAAQESVVSVGLLEAREVGPGPRRVPVEELQPVLAVVRVPVGNHVREGQHLGSAAELVLCFLLLFNLLGKAETKGAVGPGGLAGPQGDRAVAVAGGLHPGTHRPQTWGRALTITPPAPRGPGLSQAQVAGSLWPEPNAAQPSTPSHQD